MGSYGPDGAGFHYRCVVPSSTKVMPPGICTKPKGVYHVRKTIQKPTVPL